MTSPAGQPGEDPQDLAVQSLQLGQALQLHLQQVASAELALQMLDGADAPGGERKISWQGSGETRWGRRALGPGQPGQPSPTQRPLFPGGPRSEECWRLETHPTSGSGHHDGHTVAPRPSASAMEWVVQQAHLCF